MLQTPLNVANDCKAPQGPGRSSRAAALRPRTPSWLTAACHPMDELNRDTEVGNL